MTTGRSANFADEPDALRIGLIADAHYADKPSTDIRFYRDSLAKLSAAVESMQAMNLDLAVQLGDFIDSTGPEDADRLREIDAVFKKLDVRRCYVFGNHCLERLTKPQYLEIVGQAAPPFSFDSKGIHIVVLDACFRADGQSYDAGPYEWHDSDIPPQQRAWLESDLASTSLPTIAFVHQRLDSPEDVRYGIASQLDVRGILEQAGNVKLVVHGHYHAGGWSVINGITYLTLPAMVVGEGLESSGHSLLTVRRDGSFSVKGFGRHQSYEAVPA